MKIIRGKIFSYLGHPIKIILHELSLRSKSLFLCSRYLYSLSMHNFNVNFTQAQAHNNNRV